MDPPPQKGFEVEEVRKTFPYYLKKTPPSQDGGRRWKAYPVLGSWFILLPR